MASQTWIEQQKQANKERKQLLQVIGSRSVSATMLTRELYPDAFIPSPEYQHIRYRLNQMVKRGEIMCDEPQPSQERRYFQIQMEQLL